MPMMDSTGRGTETPQGMSAQQVLSMLSQTIRAPAKNKVLDNKSGEKNGGIDKLLDIFPSVVNELKDIGKKLDATKDVRSQAQQSRPLTIQGATESLKGLNVKRFNKSTENQLKDFPKAHKALEKSAKGSAIEQKFYAAGLSDHTLSFKSSSLEEAIRTGDLNIINAIYAAQKAGHFGPGGGGGGGGKEIGMTGGDDKGKSKLGKGIIEGAAFGAEKALGGFKLLDHLFEGAVTDGEEFKEEMNQIALQTQGVNGEMKGLQDEWLEVGDVVERTGMSLSRFNKTLPGLIKKGSKGYAQEVDLLKTSSNLSRRIGSNAAETAETFHDMGMTLGMSNSQMSQFNRGVQSVALSTGVTGDNLLHVVKSTGELLKDLRDASQLSAETATNFTEMGAAAGKRGIGGLMSALNKSSVDLVNLMEADNKTRNLMVRLANKSSKELIAGNFGKTKDDMKEMIANARNLLKQSTGVDETGIAKLKSTKEGREKLNYANASLKASYNIRANDLKLLIESLQESSKTYSERFKEAEDALGKLKHTKADDEKRIKLEEDKNKLQIDMGLQFLNTFTDMAKDAGSDFSKSVNNAGNSLDKEFQVGLDKPVEKMREMLLMTAKGLKGRATAQGVETPDFSKQIEDALKSQDKAQMKDLIKAMSDEQEKLGTQESKGTDPVTTAQYEVMKVNEKIRQTTDKWLQQIVNLLGAKGFIYLGVIASAATLLTLAKTVLDIFGFISGKLLGLLGKGKGAASAAEKAAGAIPTGAAGKVVGVAPAAEQAIVGLGGAAEVAAPEVVALAEGVTVVGAEGAGAAAAVEGAASAFPPLAIALAAIAIGVGSMAGAINAGNHAAQIFGMTQKEFTKQTKEQQRSMELSAKAAGSLTGVLNMLTLGLFSAQLGAEGTWTKAIAKWDQAVGILSAILKPLIFVFDLLWEQLQGLWKEVKEFWNGLSKELEPALAELWKSLQELWETLKPIMPLLKGIATAIAIWFMLPLVTSIAAIVAVIMVLKAVVHALTPIIQGVIGVITGIVNVVKGVIKVFYGLWEVISGFFIGIFTGNWDKLKKGFSDILAGLYDFFIDGIWKIIWSAIKGIGVGIYKFLESLVTSIIGFFSWLYDKLVGHSIIPDLIYAIIEFFAMLPIRIIKIIAKFVVTAVKKFLELGVKILKAIGKVIPKIIEAFAEMLIDILKSIGTEVPRMVKAFGDMMIAIFKAIGTEVPRMVKAFAKMWIDVFAAMGNEIPKIVVAFAKMWIDVFKAMGSEIPKIVAAFATMWVQIFESLGTEIPRIVKAFADMLVSVLNSMGQELPKITAAMGALIVSAIMGAGAAIASAGKWLGDKALGIIKSVGGWFSDMGSKAGEVISSIGGWFSDMGSKAGEVISSIGGWFSDMGKGVSGVVSSIGDLFSDMGKSVWDKTKDLASGVGNTASSAWEGTKSLASSAWDKTKEVGGAVLDAINPMNWFEEGTRTVTKDGAAMIHKGEMVVPADQVAQGSGPYDANAVAGAAASDLAANGKLTNTAIPLANRGETAMKPMANDVSTADVDWADKIGNDKMGADAGAGPSKDMAKIAESTADTASGIEDLHSSIRELVSIMRSAMSQSSTSGSSGGSGAAPTQNTPKGPSLKLDGTWPDSQGFRNPNKALMGQPG